MAGGKIDPKFAAVSAATVRAMNARLSALEMLVSALASIALDDLNPGDPRRDRMFRAISEIQQRTYDLG